MNIVPVIAKSDTLTQEECARFKKQVCKTLHLCDERGDDDDHNDD